MTWKVKVCPKRMQSPGINGEGELRGQPANSGSPGKMAVKAVCVVCIIRQAAAVSRRTELFFCMPKNRRKIGIGRKSAEIYFSSNRRKNFSLNPHYDEIIFDSPGFYIAI